MEYRLHEWVFRLDRQLPTDVLVQQTKTWLSSLRDQDIGELLMTGFIPDLYEENKQEEKLFAKLMEVVVAESFRRIGFDTMLVKTKSECEDVRITAGNSTVLVDVKTFRLGRSQIAPNVKDFIKLNTVKSWIHNFNQHRDRQAIGGLVVYPSTHEWLTRSQVYKQCSDQSTPVVMLSYEILAYLLQEKESFKPKSLFALWQYDSLFPEPIATRQDYWTVISDRLSTLLNLGPETLESNLDVFRLYYTEVIKETQSLLIARCQTLREEIPKRIEKMDDSQMRNLLTGFILETETAGISASLENILKNRKPFLTVLEPNPIDNGVA